MKSSKFIFFTATLLAVVTLSVVYLFTPPPIAGAHDSLQDADVLPLVDAVGPESLAFDPNGEGPYTGVANGRILKWLGKDHGWTEFAVTSPAERKECGQPHAPEMEHICGRPLGLRFHEKTGDLYIADAYFGLQVVGPNGGLTTQLITEAENQTFRFTNDVDIDEDENMIYFTDTSTIFQRRQFLSSVLTHDKTGRLMQYHIPSKKVKVLMRDLAFANGVTLNKNRSFVLVAETTNCRILRHWLQGPKAGSSDVFVELPGFPDNIRRNSEGEFWVALHSKKGIGVKWVLSFSTNWFRKVILKFPLNFKQVHYFLVRGMAHASVARLSEDGKVVEVLEDSEGKTLRFVSEVEERNGELWIGSVMMPFIGKYNLKV